MRPGSLKKYLLITPLLTVLLLLQFCASLQAQSSVDIYNEIKAYQNAGQIDKSIPYFETLIHKIEEESGKTSREYSMAYGLWGYSLIQIERYSEGLALCQKAIDLVLTNPPDLVQDYQLHSNNVAIAYYRLGKYEKAEKYFKQALEGINIDSKYYIQRTENLALVFTSLGRQAEALALREKVIELMIAKSEGESITFLTKLSVLADGYTLMGDYNKASVYAERTIELAKKHFGDTSDVYGVKLINRAVILYGLGKMKEGIIWLETSLRIMGKTLGEDHPSYIVALQKLALYKSGMGEHQKAESLINKILDHSSKSSNKNSIEYLRALEDKSRILLNAGKYQKAQELIHSLIVSYHNPRDKIDLVNNLVQLLRLRGKYREAIQISDTSIVYAKSELGENSQEYIRALMESAHLKHTLGYYEKAIIQYEYALQLTEDLYPEQTYRKEIPLNNLSSALLANGEYIKAIKLLDEAFRGSRQRTDSLDINYTIQLNNMSVALERLGRRKEAKAMITRSLRITKSLLGKNHVFVIEQLSNLGELHLNDIENEKAMKVFQEALEIVSEHFGNEHPKYHLIVGQIASTEHGLGNYSKAVELHKKAISGLTASLDSSHIYVVNQKTSLAISYQALGKTEETLKLYQEVLELTKKNLGTTHADYQTSLANLAGAHWELKRYEEAHGFYKTSSERLIGVLESRFGFLSLSQKKTYLEKLNYKFDVYESFMMDAYSELGAAVEQGLNNKLWLKGLLLNRSKNILRDLESLNDKAINNRVLSLRSIRSKIAKASVSNVDIDEFDLTSLTDSLNQLEADLVSKHTTQFGKKNYDSANWKTIRDHLDKGEVVIEFSQFQHYKPIIWTDSLITIAYIIRPDWESPQLVVLKKAYQAEEAYNDTPNPPGQTRGVGAISTKSKNNTEHTFEQIWQPLTPYLKGVQKVYFSVDGTLHQTPIASLINAEGITVSDQFEMIQMANTGSIVKTSKPPSPKDILLMGGINYDYGSSQEVTDPNTEKIKGQVGSNWLYLSGTQEEIENIEDLFTQYDISSTKWDSRIPTEEKFKALSGNGPQILHIATHGFFFENPGESKQIQFNGPVYSRANDPLIRSGLLLAGANYAWQKGYNPSQKEDGILTALEISNMDLSNTELVVLSACETGLGEINGSEGVYGLQRAFKMAGVNYIMMSLWKIPDKETAEFMELFYSLWLDGKELRQSFIETQRAMSKKYRGQPEKWAGFVLVN